MKAGGGKKKLSYREQREWDEMEAKLLAAETTLEEVRAMSEDPSIAADAGELQKRFEAVQAAQGQVDALYARWAELEAKRK